MSAAVEVTSVRKRYRSKDPWAVDDVTFEVPQGQAFGLLGPNGAGKTTIVKMLAGLHHADSGSVRVFGQDPTAAETRRAVGFAAEDPDFPKFLRGNEVLDYFGRLFGLSAPDRARRVTEALAWAGLGQERRQVRHFSKGMKQRLGLAQALVGQPRLLILDEPTADLDPLGRRAVRDLILHMKEAGITVLLNSHLLSEVERVCDNVGIIHRGRLLKIGAVHELVPEGRTLEDVFLDLVAPGSGAAGADNPMPSFMTPPPSDGNSL